MLDVSDNEVEAPFEDGRLVAPIGSLPPEIVNPVVLSPVKDYYLVWKVIEHNLLEVIL